MFALQGRKTSPAGARNRVKNQCENTKKPATPPNRLGPNKIAYTYLYFPKKVVNNSCRLQASIPTFSPRFCVFFSFTT